MDHTNKTNTKYRHAETDAQVRKHIETQTYRHTATQRHPDARTHTYRNRQTHRHAETCDMKAPRRSDLDLKTLRHGNTEAQGDEAPEQETGHDDGVVQGKPVRVPETQPFRAGDTEHAECEAQLVNHLHLGHLLHVIPKIVNGFVDFYKIL